MARLFYQNPKIIIMDEPTSSLDSTTEEKITNNLINLFKDKTLIIVAHRLQTIKNVDKILVIEQGKITEQGNFRELLDQGGKFKELWEKQTKKGEKKAA